MQPDLKYVFSYTVTATVMVVLDLIWLGLVAKPLYQRGIGHLMAPEPNIVVAVLFYALFALGLVIFSVAPHVSAHWSKVVIAGALFGFFAYSTYDLTNLATLKDWPVGLSVLDMAWGTTVSAVSAFCGKLVIDRF
jgi:uncharacterized membrane protein